MNKQTAKMLRQKQAAVKEYYASLDHDSCRETKLVTANKKLQATGQNVCGVALYPDFKGSCSDALSCKLTCIAFTGVANVLLAKKVVLSSPDKASLRRLWLFNESRDYFYRKLKLELQTLLLDLPELYFREVTSECLDYSKIKMRGLKVYGYFKHAEKISKAKQFGYQKAIYSWDESSGIQQTIDCFKANVPIAVVIPRSLHKAIFNDGNFYATIVDNVMLHNGDLSDLQSHNHLEKSKINLHLLSEKVSRFSKIIGKTAFLNSYTELFRILDIESE